MPINVQEDKKIVEVRLTRAERDNPSVKENLKPLYGQYKQKNYTVAVFQSGNQDLYTSTLDLLTYNRRHIAEQEVQAEKEQGYQGLCM